MASPFKVFRKHQKVMLALLGVLVMVGFVILPAIMQGMGQQTRANPRVATTKNYGDLHSSKLAGLRWRRQIASRFFDALGRALVMADANPAPVQMALREMVPNQEVSPTSDEALVETWLLARRAEELGLVVDDATISAFIRNLMQDRITPDGLAAILQRADISDKELLSVLRQELLAMRLRGIFRLSVQGTTPAERWDYFQRLNRKVTIESLPVRVEDFFDAVDDPDEATLQNFFDEYKAEPYDPASPEPGFREPKKVDVEYLKAEYESFFQREVDAVSPEDLKAYYEEHKEDYRQETLPVPDEEEPAPVDSEAKAEEGEPAAPESSGEPEKQAETASESPVGEEGEPSAEPTSAMPEGGGAAAEPKYLPLEKVEEEIRNKLARDKATVSIEKVLADLRSQLERYHERLILFEVERQGDPGDTAPEKPDFNDLAEQHGLIAGKTGLISALEAEQLEIGIGKSSLGQQTSFIEAVFEQLPSQRPEISQDTDGNHYLFWKVNESEERIPETAQGFHYERAKGELATLRQEAKTLRTEGAKEKADEKTKQADELERQIELWERVLRAWKTIAARVLAVQAAEEMAARAREAGKPLAKVFPARASDVDVSKPFSWLTYGAIQPWMAYAPPSLSAVEGVDTPGTDFMRAVFALKKGEVGASMNQPQTVAYVVRLTDSTPLPAVLWSQFTAESYLSYFRASWHDQSMAEEAWLDGLKKEVGFAWDPAWQREAARR